MNHSIRAVLAWKIVLVAVFAALPLSTLSLTPKFVIFKAFHMTNEPSFTSYGLQKLRVVGRGWQWPNGRHELPDKATFQSVVRKLAAESSDPVAFDIEGFPLPQNNDPVLNSSLRKYLTVASWIRQAAPNLKFGFYGVPPVKSYWVPQRSKNHPTYAAWVHANTVLKPLASKVDYIFPSLYVPYYDDKSSNRPVHPSDWVKFAVANIQEAKRISDKPIYPFLSMQYHTVDQKHDLELFPADYWRTQLNTVRLHADGVVIWGGYSRLRPFTSYKWDENYEWWQETKRFIRSLSSQP